MRILIVEDEAPLLAQLRDFFAAKGYAVDAAANAREGQYLGEEYPIDVAIVDLGLPDFSGLELIRRWRASGCDFPILILTARGRWQEKVEGLEAGADDYLVKPFHFEELWARINALIRRAAGQARPQVKHGPITLDTAAQTVARDGEPVALTAFEYKVLEYLMLHPGKVISKTELTEHLYDQDFERDSNVLEVFIGRLRRKLDPDGALQPIETLRGRGYRWTLAERR
ncbi:two-component system, OmpR family, response regulator PhoP [Methylomarinovum tepidoasis]|uniref:Two-component system, OmpR family, response regulator PhoP n=1 Tax=Methylomarinovum tepidoasis TaxID=2840183 RepID=A0AAU9CUW8_9GAMM|nr:response regulator transcription factor [Methylomarinovum sp. IN45]BCX88465.1 two-component system, OmpR family, response regulator PhoP [Methylomarinovum sp. IN45]